jgi:hypothetical protein
LRLISGNCSRQSTHLVIAQQQTQGHTGRVRANASVLFEIKTKDFCEDMKGMKNNMI